MGWVHPWLGLGWVESHFPAHVMGWVGLNEKYCGIVAEYCKTSYFSLPLIFTFRSYVIFHPYILLFCFLNSTLVLQI